MGFVSADIERILKYSEEEREKEHRTWLQRKLYAKTPLTTAMYCEEKFLCRYDRHMDEHWGVDLVEGIAGHKVLEVYHAKLLAGQRLFPNEAIAVFRGEWKRIQHRLKPGPFDVDSAMARILPLCSLYFKNWERWYRDVTGVEITFGDKEEVTMGGKRIGGHIDLEAKKGPTPGRLVTDFKFVGSRSGHRKEKLFDLGMEMYKKARGVRSTFILPLVKDLKRQPRDLKPGAVTIQTAAGCGLVESPVKVHHSKQTHQTAEDVVEVMVDRIESGVLGRPPSDPPGSGLCHPKWCDFFGRCRWTKHLSRRVFS